MQRSTAPRLYVDRCLFQRRAPWLTALCLTVLCALGTLVAQPVRAQSSDALTKPDALTLDAAHQRLLDANRELRAAHIAIDAATADLQRASVRPNPTLSASLANTTPHQYKPRDVDQILRIEQLVERGDKRQLRSDVATRLIDASRQDLANVQRVKRGELWAAYYALVAAQQRMQIVDDNLATLQRLVEQGERRVRAGDLAALDLNRLQVDLARGRGDRAQAQAQLQATQISLAAVLAAEPQALLIKAVDVLPSQRGDPIQVAAAMTDERADQALQQRADVAVARARVQAAQAAASLAQAQQTRDLTVGLQTEKSPSLGGRVLGISVAVPLFINNDFRGDIARAQADLAAAQAAEAAVFAQARADLLTAQARLRGAALRLDQLARQARPQSQKALSQVEYGFQRGALAVTDVLDARRQHAAVQLEHLDAELELARAYADWRAALGWIEL